MEARKAVAWVLVAAYCVAQAAGCTSPSGERSRSSTGASGGASSGARAVLDDAALTAKVTSALTAAGSVSCDAFIERTSRSYLETRRDRLHAHDCTTQPPAASPPPAAGSAA